MKLKTLTIHNIASIEDATIDFAGQQLAGQDLFLICGPTGAGKSTILDSICLALFNTTPRIKNSANDDIDTLAEDDKKKKEKVKDPMHLVRKNAPDASIVLTFEDVDGKECTAMWSVKRKVRQSKNNTDAKKYENETLEEKLKRGVEKIWAFTDGDGKDYQTVTAVEEQIQLAIGMNFDQFCKTTMLAQGDFTKFLSSSSDEKAQILEKLVGTEFYSAVGKEINLTARAKSNDVAVLQKELENIKFLSEDEINERQEKIFALSDEIKALDDTKKAIDAKLKWIEDSRKAMSGMESAKVAMTKAEEALAAEDVKADAALTELWFKTTEVRNAIRTQETCASDAEKQNQEQIRLEEQFVKAVAGLNALNHRAETLNKEIEAKNDNVAKQKKFEDMFAHASVICKAHEDVVANQKFISESEPKLSDFDAEIAKFEKKANDLKTAKENAEKEISAAENKRNGLQEELQKHGADNIDSEVSKLHAHKMLVSQTENAITAWSDAKEDCARKQEALQKANDKQKSLDDAATKAASDFAEAEKAYKTSKEVYEKTKASVEDHAKVLRAELKVGDHCPVCGNLVEEVLTDEKFVNMLKPLEEVYRKDDKAYDECKTANEKAKAEAKAGEHAVKSANQDVITANAKLDKSFNALKEKCEALGITCDDNVISRLAALKSEDTVVENKLGKRQQAIKDIRTQIDAVTQEIADIRKKKLDVAAKALESIGKDIAKQKEGKEKLSGEIETAKKTAKSKQQEIDNAVNSEWKPASEENFFTELEVAAKKYDDAKSQIINMQSVADQYKKDCSIISNFKDAILKKFADWSKYEDTEAQEVKDLTSVWTDLQSNVNVLASNISKTAEEKKTADASVTDFFDKNNDVEIDAVKSIMSFSARDIEQKQRRIKMLNDAMVTATAGFEVAKKQMNELPVNPLSEGDTTESLKEQQKYVGEREQAKNQEIGSIKKELATDEVNRKTQGEKKVQLEKLQAEYTEWSTLDKYLGSTDGKNFRNVAQSFILGDLLDKANAYLENITGRYTLFCNPGTLTIMMRDAYQGGVVRPTNTLSGGESFIISLSLALGLSSMQSTGFEVDTLFIDEGFGTLSPEFLDPVITSLKRLYEQYGRRVGIISHVETLKARIPVTIEVSREGNSSSKVDIVTN